MIVAKDANASFNSWSVCDGELIIAVVMRRGMDLNTVILLHEKYDDDDDDDDDDDRIN
jgi:hypothetical protein